MTQETDLFNSVGQSHHDPPDTENPARTLQTTMAAVRLSVSWLGTRKSLTDDQKRQAAETFGAADSFLSAGKKLLDTRDPHYRAVTKVRTQAVQYWRGMTLPYPEAGIRLIRHGDIALFHSKMQLFQHELREAVEVLNLHYTEMRIAARERLGELYNPADYPDTLADQFALAWDFPNVTPPEYLLRLSPHLYEQEQQRIARQFEEAVELAEEAFLSEFGQLISHLTERLTGESDGKPKVFRDTAISNLNEFFQRFRKLNIRSNPELDRLVAEARQIVQGVRPQQLRDPTGLREHVAQELSRVEFALGSLLVERPRRNLLRD